MKVRKLIKMQKKIFIVGHYYKRRTSFVNIVTKVACVKNKLGGYQDYKTQ